MLPLLPEWRFHTGSQWSWRVAKAKEIIVTERPPLIRARRIGEARPLGDHARGSLASRYTAASLVTE